MKKPARIALLLAIALGASLPAAISAPASHATSAAATLPALPAAWPYSHLELGLTDSPSGAQSLRASTSLKLRYQYLCAGVNTGSGWATWNDGAQFPDYYVADSAKYGFTPVFIYYQLLQSKPGIDDLTAGRLGEGDADIENLQNAGTMKAYWADVRLMFQHLGAYSTPIVVDVEPDLWGYIQQHATSDRASTVAAAVASSGDADVAGLPNNAAGFAQAIVKLRDRYAPKVMLGYELSTWGTYTDPIFQDTPLTAIDALAARSAAFQASLGAKFDLVFTDPADRDAGFDEIINGDGGASWWSADDYARFDRYVSRFVAATGRRMVLWQVPLGNTKMRAMDNTWGHYQDNHVEWWFGDGASAHLASTIASGVVAILYGGGADGTTSASDARGDGVTNPSPINGNTTTSYSADDDGGYFRHQAAAYYSAGAVALPSTIPSLPPSASPSTSPTVTPSPTNPVVTYQTAASVATSLAVPGRTQQITARVTASAATTALVDVELYGPGGTKVVQWSHDAVTFSGGTARSWTESWAVPAGAASGTYTVKIGVFAPGWGAMRVWNDAAATFTVAAGSTYVPVEPFRLLDSRDGTGLSGRFASKVPRSFRVAGRGTVPANAVAITGNLTLTNQTAGGYATLGPSVASVPSFSTLNAPHGDNRANGVSVALAGDGSLAAVYVGEGTGGTADLILDVTGYYLADGSHAAYHAVAPYRALDTREGTGVAGRFTAGVPRTFALGSGVPATAVAVMGNLTVSRPTAKGFIALGPAVAAKPSFSTLNFPVKEVRANNVTVKVGTSGGRATLSAVYVATAGAATDIVFDVTGYFVAGPGGAAYVPIAPVRLVDTRKGQGIASALAVGGIASLSLAGNVPAGSVGVTGNATVARPSAGGYVSVAPSLTWPPKTSSLNFPAGDIRANGTTVPITTGRTLAFAFWSATTTARADLVFDLTGYFVPLG